MFTRIYITDTCSSKQGVFFCLVWMCNVKCTILTTIFYLLTKKICSFHEKKNYDYFLTIIYFGIKEQHASIKFNDYNTTIHMYKHYVMTIKSLQMRGIISNITSEIIDKNGHKVNTISKLYIIS